MARVYVAASWRTERQPAVVEAIRAVGHEVYDFRNPPNGAGFGWEQVGKKADPRGYTPSEFLAMLAHPRALEGFASDIGALRAADVCVLVQPSGRSAALELGYAAGMGKRCAVLLEYYQEPELMLKVADLLTPSMWELLQWLGIHEQPRRVAKRRGLEHISAPVGRFLFNLFTRGGAKTL